MKILYIMPKDISETGAIEFLLREKVKFTSEKPLIVVLREPKLIPDYIIPDKPHAKYIKAPRISVKSLLKIGMIGWNFQKRKFQSEFLKYVADVKPDLIYNHAFEFNYLIPKGLKVPVIYRQHQGFEFYKLQYLPWPFSLMARTIVRPRKSMRLLSGIGVNSSTDAKFFQGWLGSSEMVFFPLVNFSLMPDNFVLPLPEERNKKGLFLGRLVPVHKGIYKICKFAKKNQVEIDFYGQGPERVIRKIEKTPFVNYKGFTTENPVILNAKYDFNICISNPKFEGQPLQILEALSAGTKIIGNKRSKLHPFARELYDAGLLHCYDKLTWKTAEYQQKKFTVENHVNEEKKFINAVVEKHRTSKR